MHGKVQGPVGNVCSRTADVDIVGAPGTWPLSRDRQEWLRCLSTNSPDPHFQREGFGIGFHMGLAHQRCWVGPSSWQAVVVVLVNRVEIIKAMLSKKYINVP